MAAAEFPVATSPAPGVMGVDWEDRVDFRRLRDYRLARVRQILDESELGAVLLFETSNIRYATGTHIGYWAFNKGERYALVTSTGPPRIWDFGSAAKAHRLQLPDLYDTTNSVGGNTGLQGAIGSAVRVCSDAPQRRSPPCSRGWGGRHAARGRHGRDLRFPGPPAPPGSTSPTASS